MGFEVEVRNVDGAVTALGASGPHTLVVDRPSEVGGPCRSIRRVRDGHLACSLPISPGWRVYDSWSTSEGWSTVGAPR